MFKVLLCVTMQHDWRLVGLAALVCVCATVTTFFLYARVPGLGLWRRWSLLAMTGLVAGSGIWTTHFVAMLAFRTGLPTGYAMLATSGSLGVAIVSTTLGFALASSRLYRVPSNIAAIVGGLIVGFGITLMHYIGMHGYRTAGIVEWDQGFVAASGAIGAVFAAASLFVARPGSSVTRQFAAAGLLTLAIVGMHFIGMTAVTIVPDPNILVPPLLLSDREMIFAAIAVTALILIATTGGVALDTASRNNNLRRLREALDALPEGLAFYDAQDRLVIWNSKYGDLCNGWGGSLMAGMRFDDLLASSLVHGVYPKAIGREEEWIAERRAMRKAGTSDLTQPIAGGRWLRVTERRTADGGTVSVTVDITDLKRTEQAMAEARDKAEELARRAEIAEGVAGLGHWRMDARTHELIWSPQMYLIYGLDPEAPLDLETLMAMAHPDDAKASAANLKRLLVKGERSDNWTTRIVRPNGETRYLESNSHVERDADGTIRAVIGTVVDITAQKLAQIAIAQSETRFRRLANNAPDIITECELDGTFKYVSPAALPITGFAPEELVGRKFSDVMFPEDAVKVEHMCQTVFASKGKVAPWPVEFRALNKAGVLTWLECKPTLSVDPVTGRFTGLNDVIRDITPRKAIEAELRRARAEAEAAASVKAEFLANMSHELRTPLTSIIGFTGLAAEQPELSDLTREYVDRVGNASQALLCTVNDILDFSKLEAGQVEIHPKPVSLAALGRSKLDYFTPQAEAKDLTLSVDLEPADAERVVAVDPDRVRQILLNLIGNAVKFTETGSVSVRIRYDGEAAMLGIEVIDTGCGIAAEKQQQLFKRFSQVDGSMTRAQGGTGLGLAICKGLVEAMGGEVGVESHEGKGSRFWLRIPAPAVEASQVIAVKRAPSREAFAGIRVLVADDHPLNRKLANLLLASLGAEVTEACDGEEAVQRAAEWPFDVILMDMRMPKLDGIDALRRIRSGPGPNDATPIVAFTAGADSAFERQAASMGFQGVLPKPFTAEVLLAVLTAATVTAGMTEPREFAHAG